MMRRGSQLRATSFLIVAAAMALAFLTLGGGTRLAGVRGLAATVFAPIQAVFSGAGNGVRGFAEGLNAIGDLRRENQQLKQQVADLQKQLIAARTDLSSNQQLKAMLDLRGALGVHTVGAEVIARDPEGLTQSVTIRIAGGQAIKNGMVVLGQHGLVGRVVAVHGAVCQVRLITDSSSPVSVMLASSHLPGTVKMVDGRMRLEIPSAPVNLKINPGEVLVTSGLGGNYPKDVPVAEVVRYQYQAYGAVQVADATPLDALDRVEYVQVDLDYVPDLTP
jgi:rod shape-determining protein MreC